MESVTADKQLLLNISYDASCSIRKIESKISDCSAKEHVYCVVQNIIQKNSETGEDSARLALYYIEKGISAVNSPFLAGLIADAIEERKDPLAVVTVLRNYAATAESSRSIQIVSHYLDLVRKAHSDFGAKTLAENLTIINNINAGQNRGRILSLMDKAADFEHDALLYRNLRDSKRGIHQKARIDDVLEQAKKRLGNDDLYSIVEKHGSAPAMFEIRQMLNSERTIKNLMRSKGSVLETPETKAEWRTIENGIFRYVWEAVNPCKNASEAQSALSLIAEVADRTKSIDLTLQSCKLVEKIAKKSSIRVLGCFVSDAIIPSEHYSETNARLLECLCKISSAREAEKFAYKTAIETRKRNATRIVELCDKVEREEVGVRSLVQKKGFVRIKG